MMRTASAPSPVAQELAAGDQRAEDQVGEVGLGAHEPAELGGRDASTRPGPVTRAVRQGRWPVSRFSSPRNRGRRRRDQRLCVVGPVGPDDLGLALEHHEEVVGVVAGPVQHLAGRRDRARCRTAASSADGGVGERRGRSGVELGSWSLFGNMSGFDATGAT